MSAESYDGPSWIHFCPYCEKELVRGEEAYVCTDPEECPKSDDWGGACGFLVCEEYHHPIRDLERRPSE